MDREKRLVAPRDLERRFLGDRAAKEERVDMLAVSPHLVRASGRSPKPARGDGSGQGGQSCVDTPTR